MMLAVLVAALGVLALLAVVVGMLWLVQFVLQSEERGRSRLP